MTEFTSNLQHLYEYVVFQDTMNEFFKGSSIDERGTLCQLKADFKHRNLKVQVMQCFNHCNDFFIFVSEAFSTILAMHILGITSPGASPRNSPFRGNKIKKEKYFKELCTEIVDSFWQQVDMSEVAKVATAESHSDPASKEDVYQWCTCNGGIILSYPVF